MSGSEMGGVITTREQLFALGINQKAPVPQVAQSMRLAYSADGTAVYNPVVTSSPQYQGIGGGGVFEGSTGGGDSILPHNLNMSAGESTKRKRGRPRKYVPDGTMALAMTTAVHTVTATPTSGGSVAAFSPPSVPSSATAVTSSVSASSLKKRGRPRGSSKKQQLEALGTAGVGFTPHIITVKAGEDVSSKIMAFSQNGPRAVCILSASGAISNVTLRQAATSGGTATYEGRFDILSLSGSFLLTEVGGQRSRTGGLSVSLSGPDGRVLGGCVAGLLTAASLVQVIVGSFIADGRKESKPVNHMEPSSVPTKITLVGGMAGDGSPTSHGTSESSGGPGSPLNQSTGAYTNSNLHGMASMPWK